MKQPAYFFALAIVVLSLSLPVQASDSARSCGRDYTLMLGMPEEMDAMGYNGIFMNKAFADMYLKGIMPKVHAVWLETTWTVFWTFMSSLWPHE